MSTKENNEVAVEKVTENDKASADAKCDIKGIKRPAEVSTYLPTYLSTISSLVGSRADIRMSLVISRK